MCIRDSQCIVVLEAAWFVSIPAGNIVLSLKKYFNLCLIFFKDLSAVKFESTSNDFSAIKELDKITTEIEALGKYVYVTVPLARLFVYSLYQGCLYMISLCHYCKMGNLGLSLNTED